MRQTPFMPALGLGPRKYAPPKLVLRDGQPEDAKIRVHPTEASRDLFEILSPPDGHWHYEVRSAGHSQQLRHSWDELAPEGEILIVVRLSEWCRKAPEYEAYDLRIIKHRIRQRPDEELRRRGFPHAERTVEEKDHRETPRCRTLFPGGAGACQTPLVLRAGKPAPPGKRQTAAYRGEPGSARSDTARQAARRVHEVRFPPSKRRLTSASCFS